MPYKYDMKGKGLGCFFRPWEIIVINYLEETHPQWASTREISSKINESTTISRSSVIQFLKNMKDNMILEYSEKTGKGGHRGLYRLKYKDQELRLNLVTVMIDSLLTNFPSETRKIITRLET